MSGIDGDSRYGKEFQRFTLKLRKRVQTLRLERGLTQEDMLSVGISLRQYQRIESGETENVTLASLYLIAKALKLSLAELLDL